jgi:hypothetical protein
MTISGALWRSFVGALLVVDTSALADFGFSLEPRAFEPGQRASLTLRLRE